MVPLIVCKAYKIMDIHLSTISIWHVAFLAFDQYTALKFPHFYNNFAYNKRPFSRGFLTYIGVICIMWFISMTFSIPYILGFPDSVVANKFSNYSNLCHKSYERRVNLYYDNNSKIKLNMNWDYADIFNRYSFSPTYGFENLTIFNTLIDLSEIGSKYDLNTTNYVKKILLRKDLNQCIFIPNLIMTIVGTLVSFFIPLGAMLYFLFNIIVSLRHKIQRMSKSNQTFIKGGVCLSGLVTKIYFPFYKFLKIYNSFLDKSYEIAERKTSIINGKNIFEISKHQVEKGLKKNIAILSIDNAIDASQNKPNYKNSQVFEKERRAIYYILTILVLFMICWIPFFLYYFLLGILQFENSYWVGDLLNWVGYVNSAINPIFYFFMHKGVKARKLKK
ncbi:unnamed protein product [Gordionus sp. m RMFG-2023]